MYRKLRIIKTLKHAKKGQTIFLAAGIIEKKEVAEKLVRGREEDLRPYEFPGLRMIRGKYIVPRYDYNERLA